MRRISSVLGLVGLCGVWLVAGPSRVQPAEAPETSAEAAAVEDSQGVPDGDESGVDAHPNTAEVPVLRRRLEDDMTELGTLASDAREDADLVRASCVMDKYDRAQNVMELATSELLVISDSGASDQMRQFATEKLEAAANRLTALVEQAHACGRDVEPEAVDDATRNEVDESDHIPLIDPTRTGSQPPVPPSVADTIPPTVASPIL